VYRNLNSLAEEGVIKKIDGLDNSAHFDHNTHKHYHFICDNCKRIFDVTYNVAEDVDVKAEEETGFKITGHDITFHGLCNKCKESNDD
jgi:Fur family peroxide stress response transcriptional regulator